MPRFVLISAICAAILSSPSLPASAQSANPTATMVQGAQIIRYTFKPYGSIELAAMVTEIGGRVAVCGMWTEKQRMQAHIRAGNLPRRMRSTTAVRLGNKRIMTGLGFMQEVAQDDFTAGTKVQCKLTNVPWEAGFSGQKIELLAPRLRSIG
ncbi:MAG: hypothetical protein AAF641_11505 [Pseudomonadota bacterium]